MPPAVPGIMFLSGGQSELEATLNLNAMNQSPNPWHVSFSFARALQNSVLRTWQGEPANMQKAQEALLIRAKANSDAQKGEEIFFFGWGVGGGGEREREREREGRGRKEEKERKKKLTLLRFLFFLFLSNPSKKKRTGEYDPSKESAEAGKSLYEKGYKY